MFSRPFRKGHIPVNLQERGYCRHREWALFTPAKLEGATLLPSIVVNIQVQGEILAEKINARIKHVKH